MNSLMVLRNLRDALRLSRCGPPFCRVRIADFVALLICPDVDNGQFCKDARPTDGWDHLFAALQSQTHLTIVVASGKSCTEQPWSSTSQLGDWSPPLVLRLTTVGPSTASVLSVAPTVFICLILKDSDQIATTFSSLRARPLAMFSLYSFLSITKLWGCDIKAWMRWLNLLFPSRGGTCGLFLCMLACLFSKRGSILTES